jgi:hypothetical protein
MSKQSQNATYASPAWRLSIPGRQTTQGRAASRLPVLRARDIQLPIEKSAYQNPGSSLFVRQAYSSYARPK